MQTSSGLMIPADVWDGTPEGVARNRAYGELHAARNRLWSMPPTRQGTWQQTPRVWTETRREQGGYRSISRAEAWQLVRSNSVAHSIVECIVDTFVGTGFVARSEAHGSLSRDHLMADWLSGESMPEWLDALLADGRDEYPASEVITAFFDHWSLSAMVDGGSLYDGQRALEREAYVSGRAALLLVGRGQSRGKLHLIRSEDIVQPGRLDEMDRGAMVVDGVVYDETGTRPVGYYILDGGKPRRYDGRDVIYEVYRDGAVPAFACTADKLHQLEAMFEATLSAAHIASCIGMVITSAQPLPGSILDRAAGASKPAQPAPREKPELKMAPGMVWRLEPGDSVTQVQPQHPSSQFQVFVEECLRLVGMPDRLPLEWLTSDFTRSSYSSARMAGQAMRKRVQRRHDHLLYGPMSRLYRWRVAHAVKHRELPVVRGAMAHRWQVPAWGYMDPQVEAQADQMLEDAGLKTFIDRCDEMGIDWRAQRRKLAEQQAFDRQLAQETGAYIAGVASTATRRSDVPAAEPEVSSSRAWLVGEITAAQQIVQAVAAGQLPRDSGRGLLMTAIRVSAEEAEAMLGSAGLVALPSAAGGAA